MNENKDTLKSELEISEEDFIAVPNFKVEKFEFKIPGIIEDEDYLD